MTVPNFFKKLLFSKEFHYSKGHFYLMMNVPGIILPMDGFINLIHNYRKDSKKAEERLYQVGFMQGKNAGERYKRVVGKSISKLSNFINEVGEVMGLGTAHIKKLNNGDVYAVMNPSVMAEQHVKTIGKSKKPIDNYIAGIAAGLFSVYSPKKKVKCKEVECKAMGASACKFKIDFDGDGFE